jgi:short-subunit dehydrogenase
LLQLNFLALVRCTAAALPALIRSRGHLVNIGSLASKVATPYLGAYPVSKFAVAAYTQQLRLELKPRGVHVLLVCPGPISRDDAGRRYQVPRRGLPEQAHRPGGGTKVRSRSPEDVAAKTVRACQRRRPELVVPGKARLLFALAQLWPSMGDRILRRMG